MVHQLLSIIGGIIKISEAKDLSNQILKSYGFNDEQTEQTTKNLLDAEMVGKPSHGFIRLPAIKNQLDKGNISLDAKDCEMISESSNHLHLDGKQLPGIYLMCKSLDRAISRSNGKVFSVGIKDTGYATGYMGAYARIAAENNLVYIGFTNSPGWTVPHGSTKGIWGTNPITVGIPTKTHPIIFDAASTKISIGEILLARSTGTKIKEGAALDPNGSPTTDAEKAYEGSGVLPIAEHKGSGLAFIVELLAGGLTNSRLGGRVNSKSWGGAFYILIDPTIFRPLEEFKQDIDISIKELKNMPKAEGVAEIYYPGEKSAKLRQKCLDDGKVEVEDGLWKKLRGIVLNTNTL